MSVPLGVFYSVPCAIFVPWVAIIRAPTTCGSAFYRFEITTSFRTYRTEAIRTFISSTNSHLILSFCALLCKRSSMRMLNWYESLWKSQCCGGSHNAADGRHMNGRDECESPFIEVRLVLLRACDCGILNGPSKGSTGESRADDMVRCASRTRKCVPLHNPFTRKWLGTFQRCFDPFSSACLLAMVFKPVHVMRMIWPSIRRLCHVILKRADGHWTPSQFLLLLVI